jgi:hypothetical protein
MRNTVLRIRNLTALLVHDIPTKLCPNTQVVTPMDSSSLMGNTSMLLPRTETTVTY